MVQIIGYGGTANAGWWTVITSGSHCAVLKMAKHYLCIPGAYPEGPLLVTRCTGENVSLQSDPTRRMPVLAMAVDSGGGTGDG